MFVNVIATFIMLDINELIGDLKGTVVSNPYILLLALFLIVHTYFFLMWPFFISVFSVKIKKLKFNRDENDISVRLGFFILFIQVCFFLFNSYYGVNVAGTNNKTADTPLALIWVIIPADALFVVYYAFYRDSKFFKVNLIFWLFSNIIRGWAGVILFVIFFEWCRLVRRNTLSFTKILVAVLL
ncbi:oligosaccharide repeat unit polymerase, partial [Shewanella xiamenensis]|uniref:oligosaccharide repeat unit polymerase n=1 Tax=Shewanella xiamenensis TaxID=332186 RepID=UPI00265C9425